ncbi:uncharacterized protein LOC135372846 isoform X2 [Ornithodoros turicata]|uniref:uncharacterized protein LOC135372846 isoform X2 n=1 Tax=Ornithodoros turicata TaxID=34597 RepID=UPI0031388FA4
MKLGTVVAIFVMAALGNDRNRGTSAFGPVSKRVDPVQENKKITLRNHLRLSSREILTLNSAPTEERLPLSHQNRFFLEFDFNNFNGDCAANAHYGPTIKRGSLLRLCDNVLNPTIQIDSDTLILTKQEHDLVIELTSRDGTTLYANVTYKLYPYVLGQEMLCTKPEDCPYTGTECKNSKCLCKPDYVWRPKVNTCFKNCSQTNLCPASADCWVGVCSCYPGKKPVSGNCQSSECSSTSDCVGVNTGCISGVCRCGGAYTKTGNLGDCEPAIEHLGWCPYGVCYTDNSECDKGLCRCKPDYTQKWGIARSCAKKEEQTSEQECTTDEDCGTGGQICEEVEGEDRGVCRCPKNKQLQGLKCVDIPRKVRKLNLKVVFWVTMVFVGLVVELLCFGGCLYVMHVRAQNEVDALVQQLQVTEDFEIAGDSG